MGGAIPMELIRSAIFVPGNRANMLERARSFKADIIMVDLEDSVPADEKATARGLGRGVGADPAATRAAGHGARQLLGYRPDQRRNASGRVVRSLWCQLGQGGVGLAYP